VQKAATIVGVVFLLVGVLGFIPVITTNFGDLSFAGHHSDARLFGLFQVSILHNIVHLLFGIAGLAMARTAAIIGVLLFVTWGVLAFVTNYIANIGFILGVIPPALIALLDGGVGSAVAVVVVYTVINSLIFWAYVVGALLAVPATLFLKSVLLDNSVPASWVNALVSASPSKEKPRAVRRTGRQPAEGSR
jgi:AI-2 transport protein TqsA